MPKTKSSKAPKAPKAPKAKKAKRKVSQKTLDALARGRAKLGMKK